MPFLLNFHEFFRERSCQNFLGGRNDIEGRKLKKEPMDMNVEGGLGEIF